MRRRAFFGKLARLGALVVAAPAALALAVDPAAAQAPTPDEPVLVPPVPPRLAERPEQIVSTYREGFGDTLAAQARELFDRALMSRSQFAELYSLPPQTETLSTWLDTDETWCPTPDYQHSISVTPSNHTHALMTVYSLSEAPPYLLKPSFTEAEVDLNGIRALAGLGPLTRGR